MVQWLADECFHGGIVSDLLSQRPKLDIVRAQDVGLAGTDDQTVLAWAAANNRVLLTHDKATIPGHAYDRVRAGEPMPGVFVAHGISIAEVTEQVLLAEDASEQAEWEDQVVFLPLR